MPRLVVFNNVTVDGYFSDKKGDMSWAHNQQKDAEWDEFVAENASSEGTLLLGRKTYEMMAGYWPTPAAKRDNPEVAEGMNRLKKVVFSRTLDKAEWNNTTLKKGDLIDEVRKMKEGDGEDIVILGSGSLIQQLVPEGLIDEYQLVVHPLVLGAGRTMFDGIDKKLPMKKASERSFDNGNVVLSYQPALPGKGASRTTSAS